MHKQKENNCSKITSLATNALYQWTQLPSANVKEKSSGINTFVL